MTVTRKLKKVPLNCSRGGGTQAAAGKQHALGDTGAGTGNSGPSARKRVSSEDQNSAPLETDDDDQIVATGVDALVRLRDAGLCMRRLWRSCSLGNLQAVGRQITRVEVFLLLSIVLSGWFIAAFVGGWRVAFHEIFG